MAGGGGGAGKKQDRMLPYVEQACELDEAM